MATSVKTTTYRHVDIFFTEPCSDRANTVATTALHPPFTNLFTSQKDPRISFFEKHLGEDGLSLVVHLRSIALEGTPFEKNRIEPFKSTVLQPTVDDRGRTYAPPHEVKLIDILEQILLTQRNQKSWGRYSLLLNTLEDSTLGLSRVLSAAAIGLALLASCFEKAFRMDTENHKMVDSKIHHGTCKWVAEGCDNGSPGGRRFGCYLPQKECTKSSYLYALIFFSFAIASVGVSLALRQRTNKHLELMKAEFNHERHDTFLNALCKKESIIPLDWSQNINVNSKPCTARTLMLMLLTSCDDEIYKKVFSDILPTLADRDEVTLHEDSYVMRLTHTYT